MPHGIGLVGEFLTGEQTNVAPPEFLPLRWNSRRLWGVLAVMEYRMKKFGCRLAGLVGVLAFGFLGACSSSTPTASSDPQLQTGRQVFVARCASCHGPTGGGLVGPKLADGAMVAKYPDPAAQRAVIANGRNAMPKWSGLLSDEEIDAVLRYTREGL
jgi:mono/diheme cytochrome c family protein